MDTVPEVAESLVLAAESIPVVELCAALCVELASLAAAVVVVLGAVEAVPSVEDVEFAAEVGPDPPELLTAALVGVTALEVPLEGAPV